MTPYPPKERGCSVPQRMWRSNGRAVLEVILKGHDEWHLMGNNL